jgi:DNA repair protein RadA/Sms
MRIMNQPASHKRFVCRACNRSHTKWVPRCEACLAYKIEQVAADEVEAKAPNDVESVPDPEPDPEPDREPVRAVVRPAPQLVTVPKEAADTSEALVQRSAAPVRLCDVPEESFKRYRTDVEPIDRVLGGGVAEGSVIVLGGDPGIGKSTLGMMLLNELRRVCLYATGEESIAQAAARARRIDADSASILIIAETDVDVVLEHARAVNADVLMVDSIQTLVADGIKGYPGHITQVKECAARLIRFAKSTGTVVIMIGHVSQDGSLAGPNTLKHLVDVVMSFEAGDGDERILYCPTKNRFGPSGVRGRFRMTAHGLEPILASEEIKDDGPINGFH